MCLRVFLLAVTSAVPDGVDRGEAAVGGIRSFGGGAAGGAGRRSLLGVSSCRPVAANSVAPTGLDSWTL